VSTTQHEAHAAPAKSSTALRHRKNVALLSASQLQTLRTSFATAEGITDDRGFGYWAGIHGLPLPMYCQHGTRLFLPWHRAYLYFFELALRDLVPDAVLAWWDWTSVGSHASGIQAAYADRKVGTDPNPLYQTIVPPVARQAGKPQRTLRAPGPPETCRPRQTFRLCWG
jgi:tyrosinase